MQSNRPAAAPAAVIDVALGMLWRPRALRRLSSRRPIVLMYHAIAPGPGDYFGPEVFEQHVCLLKSRFRFISPREYGRTRRRTEDVEVLLTFDDGFLNNAVHVAPILKKCEVPAVFFVSTKHCAEGGLLWFAYLSALSRWFPGENVTLEGNTYDMSPRARNRSVRRLREYLLSLRPHPQALYDRIERCLPAIEGFVSRKTIDDHYAGMSWDHVREIAKDPLFEVGCHTVDHPFLTLCDDRETEMQIAGNRAALERVAGKPIKSLAYPAGDYDARVVAKCMSMGIGERYAVEIRRSALGRPLDRASIPRIGVYKSSQDIVGFKVLWGNFLRKTPLRFG